MNFSQTFLQILMVTLMVIASAMHVVAAARDDRKTERPRLIRAWFWTMPPVLLWLARDLMHGQAIPLVGILVFLGAWATLYPLAAQGNRVVVALAPLLFLAGCGIALQGDFGAWSRQAWMRNQILGAVLIATAIAAGIWVGAHRPELLRRAFALRNARHFVWMSALGPIAYHIPKLQSQAWALNILVFAALLSIVAARTAGSPLVPVGARGLWKHWRPALFATGFPALGSLLSGGDIAPAILMSCALCAVFGVLRQPRAAIVLTVIALFGAVGVTKSQLPSSRPAARFAAFIEPSRSASSQTLFALHAIAHGGLIGKGVGQWTTAKGRSASTLRQKAEENLNPMAPTRALSRVPLSTTDSVFAAVGSSTGIVGYLTILSSIFVLLTFLLRRALAVSDLRARCWLVSAATLWAVSFIATAGWPVNAVPIAGIAAPIFAGGFSNSLCWAVLLGVSVAWATSKAAPIGRLDVDPEWLELPVRQRRLRPLLALFGVPFLLIGAADLRHGMWQREATLRTQFLGLGSEARARDAIFRGWVVADGGKVEINAATLNNDRNKRDAPRDMEKRIAELHRWVPRGIFVVDDDGVEIVPRAFIEADRLGTLLATAARPEPTTGDKP